MLAQSTYSFTLQPGEVRIALAKRFQSVRKAIGLTQAALAERAGVSLGSLRRFETTGKVSLENLALLAWGIGRLGDFGQLFPHDPDAERARELFSAPRESGLQKRTNRDQ